jgi:peptidoglycan/LPS O-acetylase OafA/YrhL
LTASADESSRGQTPVPRTASQIPPLTGVRALAAYLVYFHHYQTKFLILGPFNLCQEMHVGVTLFFVLSGFLITWRYDRQGLRRESFLRGYFVNRFARIYPLYLALAIPTMLLNKESSVSHWFLNLTVFSSFNSGITQAWSLRVEECFYLLAPLLFLLWRRHPVLLLGVAAAVLAALFPVSKLPAARGIVGPPYELFLRTFFGRFFEFYVGIWLAKRVAKTGVVPGKTRGVFSFTALGAAGIAAVIVALAVIRTSTGRLYGISHPSGVALNNLVLPLFVGAFYWGLIYEPTLLRRALSSRLGNLLGRSSYAFYLIHMGILPGALVTAAAAAAGLLGVGARGRALGMFAHVSVMFVFLNLVSVTLYKTIEVPANGFLRRRFGSPSRDREVPTGAGTDGEIPAVGRAAP